MFFNSICCFILLQGADHCPFEVQQNSVFSDRKGQICVCTHSFTQCRIFRIRLHCPGTWWCCSYPSIQTNPNKTITEHHNFFVPEPFFFIAGELHPRECALWDGGNEENCGPHPDSCHAGDGNQPPQPISGADSKTDRCRDPGESVRTNLGTNTTSRWPPIGQNKSEFGNY